MKDTIIPLIATSHAISTFLNDSYRKIIINDNQNFDPFGDFSSFERFSNEFNSS